MKNVLSVAFVFVAAALGFVFYQWSLDGPPASEQAQASPIPIAMTLPDMEGNLRQISEWDGKPRLINFWATWCAPCRREIPLLIKTQQEHADLQIIGVAVDFLDEVRSYAETAGFNYPVLVGQEEAMAAAESTGIDFIGLPFTMIVSADGYLIQTHIGEIFESQLERIVAVLEQMDRGDLDLDGARQALSKL